MCDILKKPAHRAKMTKIWVSRSSVYMYIRYFGRYVSKVVYTWLFREFPIIDNNVSRSWLTVQQMEVKGGPYYTGNTYTVYAIALTL